MKDKVFIFTECLTFTGLGHLGRCTALAEILQEAGRDAEIVLHTDGTGLGGQISVPIRALDWKNLKMLSDFLNQENPQIVFVDSYLADVQVYETIHKKARKLICIDDTNRILYPEKSIILNPGLGGTYLDYDKEQNQIFTGIEYVLLRKPYREDFERLNVREKVESILITLGGSDQLNLVPKILEILTKIKPEWGKEVVIGSSFQNIKEIESIMDKNTKLHLPMSASEMRDLMLSVDLAVTAGGQTTYELAKCAVPMIIIETAENQKLNVQTWHEYCGIPIILFEKIISKEGLAYLSKLIDENQDRKIREDLNKKLKSFFKNSFLNGIFNGV
ncbi:UDP-2,4-diacetamido-2,4,6-trideoxy-beta-L-altropyranose hydrolase [Leptospira interrogans]|uniref:UDP-2,4-diacetamido-2,4, 6-trideoxy-beta-L-altropyranose hydrolase n=1 Tax=Leptospira interrogans serovar Pomona TaxID=44276 RepID=A0AA40WCS5_LEPIR|nr:MULTISPECIES: UDP-2,4-diacetamido-2,4,6-trideoxy-beta-L-altropyranose hydrolase [Leptospira]EJO77051.1 pseudaminic acid biosynthesis-associated protein PseG [Leptospira interrogans serovar Pomona str. Kennewicki LC82-25]EKN96462.1 pseudaminic acid biosynthesis-associated protein PseG [Leptospira interrogans serovar Pomona str. Pomona]EMF34383.1 pseudaminic acid biosynthesis-associated protein PseG [Leptospira interrogans serovar Pomona str. Fox 32256]EMI62064.1 pseudaminic acid biosynthesis-